MVKLALMIGSILLTLGLLVWGTSSYLVIDDLKDCAEPTMAEARCAPAEVIVAISGGDTRARTAEAIRLYKEGWAPQLIFSGAALDTSGPSNAEAMRVQALDAGVPNRDIVLDTQAADTAQNATGTLALLGARDKRIILVTSPYHQRRASVEFQKVLGDSVTIINHPTPSDSSWSEYWWLSPYSWFLALSEGIKTVVVSTWR
ncbi:MAG TPA: YdcF family protein [Candidatus Saccharimonadales bacterium]|nr:YdcF family protein [Candidatus Saccharimonadales bacterium]